MKFCKIKNILLLSALMLFSPYNSYSNTFDEKAEMRVVLAFEGKEVVINLYDNSVTQEIFQKLPIILQFEDYAGKEKISYFPQPLDLSDAPRDATPIKGEVTIYAPWGNLAIFYKDHKHTQDPSLIPIGRIESGLEDLIEMKNNFTATLQSIE